MTAMSLIDGAFLGLGDCVYAQEIVIGENASCDQENGNSVSCGPPRKIFVFGVPAKVRDL